MAPLVLLLLSAGIPLILADCVNCKYGFCAKKKPGLMVEWCTECVCPDGWSGKCCDKMTDLCAVSNTCDENELCEMKPDGTEKCTCRKGKTGFACQDDSANFCVQDRQHCRNGGSCEWARTLTSTYYHCKCPAGFTGTYCEYPMECSLHILFRRKRFVGSLLGSVVDSVVDSAANVKNTILGAVNTTLPPICTVCDGVVCSNDGVCVPKEGDTGYECICKEGFTGSMCEYEIPCSLVNPCKNGGECIVDPDDPLKSACKCLSIWKGDLCQEFDSCHRSRCVHGKCVPRGPTWIICECNPGFTGDRCEIDIDDCDPSPCIHDSTCQDLANDFSCECHNGTFGKRCEENPDDCGREPNGLHHCNKLDPGARCEDLYNAYRCNCSADMTGEFCDMKFIIWYLSDKFNATGDELSSLFEELLHKPTLVKDIIPFFLALQPKEKQMEASWDHEDLFVHASFAGAELDVKSDFHKWNSPTLGNCFTFNHDSLPRKRSLRHAGEREGFRALMRVRPDEYMDWIDTASLLVFVHPHKETVFGESPRFQAKPGGVTSLMISQSNFERLGGAFGVCVKDKSEVKSYYYEGEYTTDGCLRSCYQDAVFETCGCMDPRFPLKEDVEVCPLAQRECVNRVAKERGDPSNWPECSCPLPCSNGQYNVRWAQDNEAFDCPNGNKSYSTTRLCESRFQDSTLISVYFPDLVQICFKEEPRMDANKFVSNLGGLLGVLMGFSFITGVEFCFLLVRLFVALVTK